MSQRPPHPPMPVGQQLKRRREALDLTQPALAARIGIDASTVSLAERGRTEISRGKRQAWERALQLRPGTLSRAYIEGTELEPLRGEEAAGDYADLSDYYERMIWEMPGSEADRRTLIDIHRAGLAKEQRPRKRRAG